MDKTPMQPIVVGIDIGNTNTCIACVDEHGNPTTILNIEGERMTPSVVYFGDQDRVVGRMAKDMKALYPDQVVEFVNRNLGNEDWMFYHSGAEYSAEKIVSFIIRKVVSDAEALLGIRITGAVLTCPAYASQKERASIVRAGQMAGLKIYGLIDETTAALMGYGLPNEQDQTVLVYNLGGGTFDTAFVEIKGGEIRIINLAGDHYLGGRDWDETIANYLADQWMTSTGSSSNPLDDIESANDLFRKAEQIKVTLSAREVSEINIVHAGSQHKVVLDRQTLNQMTEMLLNITLENTRRIVDDAKKQGHAHPSQIILMGGATRMPQVWEGLQALFKVTPRIFIPEEASARGAALYGHKLVVQNHTPMAVDSWDPGETGSHNENIPQRTTDYTINSTVFRVSYGDITKLNADALVSSDDNYLSMSGGVSAALLSTGGETIGKEARKHLPLKMGEVAVTSAGKLKAKYIFHAVTIDYTNMVFATEESLRAAILKCMEIADALKLKTIAFPALGTGTAGFPFHLAAEVMTRTVAEYLMGGTQVELVTITLFQAHTIRERDLNIFYERAVALASLFTQSKRLNSLLGELEGIVSKLNKPSLLKRVGDLKTELGQAQNILSERAGNLERLDEIQDQSNLTKISNEVVDVSSETREGAIWEDKQLEAEVLRTKLTGLLTQLNIQISHLNRFEIEKAKYGGQLVPPRLDIAIEDMNNEISQTESKVSQVRTQLAQITGRFSK